MNPILWANVINDPLGDGFGYSNHTRQMLNALQRAGVEITLTPDPAAKVAVHLTPADYYKPIPGMTNILFTMVETATIPRHLQIEPERQPDIFIVPCEHNRRIFKQFYRGKPVYVCPEGINPSDFPFYERKKPAADEPFRFLFLGSFCERKGAKRLGNLFNEWLKSGDLPGNAQLYLKTTGLVKNGLPTVHYMKPNEAGTNFQGYRPAPGENPALPSMIIDQRNLETAELCKLYHSAHAFILPTTGEGWGLTLHEALATGCPAIWTHWSGPVDYADKTIGYPVKFSRTPIVFDNGDRSTGALPDMNQVRKRMKHIYFNYDEALRRGKKASERMHNQITWDHAARRFIEILYGVEAL